MTEINNLKFRVKDMIRRPKFEVVTVSYDLENMYQVIVQALTIPKSTKTASYDEKYGSYGQLIENVGEI